MDPLILEYPFLSPYSYVNNNPIVCVDYNGADWTMSTTTDADGNKTVFIKLTAAVINNSNNKTLDMGVFAQKAGDQIEKIFSVSYTEKVVDHLVTIPSSLDGVPPIIITVYKEVTVTIKVETEIRVIDKESDLKTNEHLISVENDDDSKMSEGETAHVDEIGGKRIFVKESTANDVVSTDPEKTNTRTIAHEAGHTLGLYHIDQKYSGLGDMVLGNQLSTYSNNSSTIANNLMSPNYSATATTLTVSLATAIQNNIKNGDVNL